MKPRESLQVDPASLHLSGSRRDGADPVKLQRPLAKHGTSIEGMPPPEVKRGSDGELVSRHLHAERPVSFIHGLARSVCQSAVGIGQSSAEQPTSHAAVTPNLHIADRNILPALAD